MKSLARIVLLLGVFLVPAAASAAISWGVVLSFGTGCVNTVCTVANNILYIINSILVPVLFAIAFIVFLYGIAKAYIFSGGDPEEVSKGHKLLLWGLIAFVVMISLWGLVNVIANSFGLAGAYAPPTPSSISPYGSVVPGGAPTYVQQQPTNYVECQKDANGNCI